jgi:hypothetical protein
MVQLFGHFGQNTVAAVGFAVVVVVVAIIAVAEATGCTALESFEAVAVVVVVEFVADNAVVAVVDKQFVAIVLVSIVGVVVSIVVVVVVTVILEDIVVGTVAVEPNNVAVLTLLDIASANLDPAVVVVAGKASILGNGEAESPQGTAGCQ